MDNRFPPTERLKSRTAFAKLFAEGQTAKHFPLRVIYVPWQSDAANHVQAGFSVSKKKFRHAVDRNRIKRLMREAYRLHRHVYLTNLQHPLAVLFIYIHHAESDYAVVEEAMKKCLASLASAQKEHTAE